MRKFIFHLTHATSVRAASVNKDHDPCVHIWKNLDRFSARNGNLEVPV
jgi:hypothetical protein